MFQTFAVVSFMEITSASQSTATFLSPRDTSPSTIAGDVGGVGGVGGTGGTSGTGGTGGAGNANSGGGVGAWRVAKHGPVGAV